MSTEARPQDLEQELGDLLDQETFEPSEEFRGRALVTDESLHEEAARDPEAWWLKLAGDLDWFEQPTQGLDDSKAPFFKWFADGKINASYNCVDRHVEAGNGDRVAFHWRGEEGEERAITYADLHRDVQRLANVLLDRGVKAGDVVGIYLPMIPEVVVSMLACARIGAPHNVVFGGFSPGAVKERMQFSEAKALITVDRARRKGKSAEIKPVVDEFLGEVPSIETVIVVRNTGDDVAMDDGRDLYYDEALEAAEPECPPAELDAENPLFILYSSGSTAKPKGILHTTGGYLTGVAWTMKHVFDLKPSDDVFWCSADVGWVTGHSYIVYGPLAERRHLGHVRGRPRLPGQGRLVAAVRRARGDDLLHRPDRDPGLHQVGGRVPRATRPLEAAPAGHGRRADQPEGLALVLEGDRRRPLSDRRHLVADGDRPHHDHDAARRPIRQARIGGQAAAGDRGSGARRGRQRGRGRPGPAGAAPPVARDAADALQGRRPLRRDLLRQVRPRDVLRRATPRARTPTATSG